MNRHTWSIEASYRDLAIAGDIAGLDRNAVRYVSDRAMAIDQADGRIDFPSIWCPTPGPWLAALAVLVERGLPLRLGLTETDAAGKVAAYAKLFPRFDAPMLATIAAIHPRQAALSAAMGEQIERAFELLRQRLTAQDRGSLEA